MVRRIAASPFDNVPVKIDIVHRQSDIVEETRELSDETVIWAELWKEKERKLFKRRLKPEMLRFGLAGQAFQIDLRTLWTPDMEDPEARPSGRTVICLHDVGGSLIDPWCWGKLALPLIKSNASIIWVAWPGFRGSRLGGRADCNPEEWMQRDHELLAAVCTKLNVRCASWVACGRSCASVMRMILRRGSYVRKRVFLYSPAFTVDELHPPGRWPPGNGGQAWRDEVDAEQHRALSVALLDCGARIWAAHTPGFGGEAFAPLQDEAKRCLRRLGAVASVSVTEASQQHACPAQLGVRVPVHALILSRALKHTICGYLSGKPAPVGDSLLEPPAWSACGGSSADSQSLPSSLAASPLASSRAGPGALGGSGASDAEDESRRQLLQGTMVPFGVDDDDDETLCFDDRFGCTLSDQLATIHEPQPLFDAELEEPEEPEEATSPEAAAGKLSVRDLKGISSGKGPARSSDGSGGGSRSGSVLGNVFGSLVGSIGGGRRGSSRSVPGLPAVADGQGTAAAAAASGHGTARSGLSSSFSLPALSDTGTMRSSPSRRAANEAYTKGCLRREQACRSREQLLARPVPHDWRRGVQAMDEMERLVAERRGFDMKDASLGQALGVGESLEDAIDASVLNFVAEEQRQTVRRRANTMASRGRSRPNVFFERSMRATLTQLAEI